MEKVKINTGALTKVLDSSTSVFFARQLESIIAETYKHVRAPLNAFKLIPLVRQGHNEGAEHITYRMYSGQGAARIISGKGTDLPSVSTKGTEDTSKVVTIANQFDYSIMDIKRAAMANYDLNGDLALEARFWHEQKWNTLAFLGDTASGINGWLTDANIPSAQCAAPGTGTDRTWDGGDKTAMEIIADLNTLVNTVNISTGGAETVDTIAMAPGPYAYIASLPWGTGTDTTILEFFKKTHPEIVNIYSVQEMSGVTFGGDSRDIAIAYKMDATKFDMHPVMPFTPIDPQPDGLDIVVPCMSRFGGVTVKYPLSQYILWGI